MTKCKINTYPIKVKVIKDKWKMSKANMNRKNYLMYDNLCHIEGLLFLNMGA